MQAGLPEEQRAPVAGGAPGGSRSACGSSSGASRSPRSSRQAVAKADAEMFSNLREMLGLDQCVAVNVGAAPTPVEVLEFFHAIGIELAELWGMSETCGFGTCNRPGHVKIGTVGPASPGVEMKIADDGELLVRGRVPDARLPQPAGEDGRGDRRRRLAAHRRHRPDRRGRLPQDRRSQEGDHHQRRRQEHVAGEHRGGAEDRQPADRPGVLHRRRPPVQHSADRARRRLRPAVGGPARPRGQGPRRAGHASRP